MFFHEIRAGGTVLTPLQQSILYPNQSLEIVDHGLHNSLELVLSNSYVESLFALRKKMPLRMAFFVLQCVDLSQSLCPSYCLLKLLLIHPFCFMVREAVLLQ